MPRPCLPSEKRLASLLLLGLVGCASPREAARERARTPVVPTDPFEGCSVSGTPGAALVYRCGPDVFVAWSQAVGGTAEGTLDALLTGVRAGAGIDPTPVEPRAKLETEAAVQWIEVGRPPAFVGLVAALPQPDGSVVGVSCLAADTLTDAVGRCRDIIGVLLTTGPPEGLRPAPMPPPTLAGQRLTVPDGCQVVSSTESSGQLICARGALFLWSLGPERTSPATPEEASQLIDELLAGTGDIEGTHTETTEVTCTALGRPAASCRSLVITESDRTSHGLMALVALSEADPRLVALTCLSAGEGLPEDDPVCQGVLSRASPAMVTP